MNRFRCCTAFFAAHRPTPRPSTVFDTSFQSIDDLASFALCTHALCFEIFDVHTSLAVNLSECRLLFDF